MLIYILPMYSPINPSIIRFNPPIIRIAAIVELHPSNLLGSTSFLIIAYNAKINPPTAITLPIREAILSGITENDVNPFTHSEINFFSE